MMTDLKVQVTTARQLLGLKLAVFTRNTASTPHCLLLELGENCSLPIFTHMDARAAYGCMYVRVGRAHLPDATH